MSNISESTDQEPELEEPPLEVLYRDERCIAVNKPPALLVHKTQQAPGENRALMQLLRDQIGQHVYTVHRLDRATSGAILFALDSDASRQICNAFREKTVQKHYLAVVRGWLATPELSVDMPLLSENRKESLPASTHFKSLAQMALDIPIGSYSTTRFSLLEASPETGRRHQIRRHLKHSNHPIIGDSNHGDSAYNVFAREKLGATRLMLHARSITIILPWENEPRTIIAPVEEGFSAVCERLGWQTPLADYLKSTSSISKNSVALGGITPPAPREP